MTSSYLIFALAGRLFGVQLSGAIEILPWRPARPVPLAYSYVEGLIDYRGIIYPVYNLAQRLGLSKTGPIGFTAKDEAARQTARSIVLLEVKSGPFGIVADSIAKMVSLVEPIPAPEKTEGIDAQYVKGLAHEGDQEILILDFERLLHAG